MNYYPHHIGDFNSATRHLTRTERSIYRDLIELYYDREEPLPKDVARLCRLVIAVTDEERTAVEQVLNEFFTETEQGFAHARCDQEIAKFHGMKEAKSQAGKASAAKRARNASKTVNERPTGVQQVLPACSTNQEPITKNQTDTHTHNAGAMPAEPGAPSAMTLEWQPDQKLLKAYAMRAGLPVSLFTHDAIGVFVCHYAASSRIETEAAWVSLLVKWIKRDTAQASNVRQFPRRQANGPDFHSGDTSWADDLGDL